MSKASEYGNALYELAVEDGIEDKIEQEFFEVTSLMEKNQGFLQLLSNPRLPASERIEILNQIFGDQIQSYLLSLLKILIEKRDISLAPLMFQEYQSKYHKDKNILPVTVVSAVTLNENQRQRITYKLEKIMKKTIMLDNKVDPTCIGGFRLEYHGNMIDASINNKFWKLQNDLKNADYSQVEV